MTTRKFLLIGDFAAVITQRQGAVCVLVRVCVSLVMLDLYTWQPVFFFAPFGDRLGLNNIIASQLWLTSLGATKSGWGLALQMRMKEDQVTSLRLLVYHFLLSRICGSINQVFNALFVVESSFPNNTRSFSTPYGPFSRNNDDPIWWQTSLLRHFEIL